MVNRVKPKTYTESIRVDTAGITVKIEKLTTKVHKGFRKGTQRKRGAVFLVTAPIRADDFIARIINRTSPYSIA